MIGPEELLRRLHELDRRELDRWIDNRWVLPRHHDHGWMFDEVDVARVEFILEIRREFVVDDEALALVLGLVDQIYGLRRQMRRLCDALAAQPEEVRRAIELALPRNPGRPED